MTSAISKPPPVSPASAHPPRIPSPRPAQSPGHSPPTPRSQSLLCNASPPHPSKATAAPDASPPPPHSRNAGSANNDPSPTTNNSHPVAGKSAQSPPSYS